MPKQPAKTHHKTVKKSTPVKKTPKKKAEPKKVIAEEQPSEIVQKENQPIKIHKSHQYLFSIGRRKSSSARARLYTNEKGDIQINGKPLNEYFSHFEYRQIVNQPLLVSSSTTAGLFQIKVSGGGLRGQAESIRLAISRILLQQDSSLKPLLKAHGLLVRDSRVKERKKYGLKSARRAPQWQKR